MKPKTVEDNNWEKKVKDVVGGMIRKYDPKKHKVERDFDDGWNNALWALLDELGLGDE